jgi:DNA-binding NarL/FixJ family response regulator
LQPADETSNGGKALVYEEDAGGEGTRKLRVLLADDHDVVRKGLRLLFENNFPFEVVEARTAREAVNWARDDATDLVFLDVRMPEQDGLWALQEIRKTRPDLPVLMLSTFSDDDYVNRAVDLGANGYVLKEANVHQLREAIDTALSGRGLYLHPSVAQRFLLRRRHVDRTPGSLSDRELEVLQLVARGATNDDIANQLYVSEKTVKSHLSSIFRKLEVTNRTQAAAKALREGIVRLDQS